VVVRGTLAASEEDWTGRVFEFGRVTEELRVIPYSYEACKLGTQHRTNDGHVEK
jgi:hypothetical protein